MRVQTLTLKPHGEGTHAKKSPNKDGLLPRISVLGDAATIFTIKRVPSKLHGVVCQKAVTCTVTVVIARNVTALLRQSGRQYVRRMREQHNEQLHGWAGRVARTGDRRGAYRVLVGKR